MIQSRFLPPAAYELRVWRSLVVILGLALGGALGALIEASWRRPAPAPSAAVTSAAPIRVECVLFLADSAKSRPAIRRVTP